MRKSKSFAIFILLFLSNIFISY